MRNSAMLGEKQIAWCKANIRGFADEDGKTRLEKYNEEQRALNKRREELGVLPIQHTTKENNDGKAQQAA